MLTRARVAQMGGARESRVAYWERTGLVSPTVEDQLAANRKVRLYSYTDALSVLVIAELRERVSLQHIRQIVSHLQALNFALTEVTFAVAGSPVHFQGPDGSWEDVDLPGQIVLREVLHLGPLKARVRSVTRRRQETVGHIERRRGTFGSRPVLAGTRVPVDAVRAYLDSGRSTADILEAYPALSAVDVKEVRQLATA